MYARCPPCITAVRPWKRTVCREHPLSGTHSRPSNDSKWPVGDLRLKGSSSHTGVSLRSPTWPHIPRKFTSPSHLRSAIAPNRLFSSSERGARVGSIPIARSIFRCLACPCVALGRDLACRPVPTVSIRAKCPQSAMPAPSVAPRQFHNRRFTFCESRFVNYTNRTLVSRKSHAGRPLAA